MIRYITPETYSNSIVGKKVFRNRKPKGCLIVGAEATNPEKVLPITNQVYLNVFIQNF